MSYEIVLVSHLIGALATGMAGAYALVTLWNGHSQHYRFSALVLAALAAFEILSGTVLSVLSVQISAASLCGRIFLYLSLVVGIEALLFARMKKLSLAYPISKVVSPVLASLVALFGAMVFGL